MTWWSWVELGGGGWSWVELGAWFSNTRCKDSTLMTKALTRAIMLRFRLKNFFNKTKPGKNWSQKGTFLRNRKEKLFF